MAADPEINIQPDVSNPHDVENKGEIELSPEVLDQARDHATSDFDISVSDQLNRAAYVSKMMKKGYDKSGVYMMAEVSPMGVHPVAVGDDERFFIDEHHDPEHIGEKASPFRYLEETGYDTELSSSIPFYEIRDLENTINVESVADAWGKNLDELDRTYLVAPGMEENYIEAANQIE